MKIKMQEFKGGKKKAYVAEVKANPDRRDSIEQFLEKLKSIPEFLPQPAQHTFPGVYTGPTVSDETVAFLTRKKLYATGREESDFFRLNFSSVITASSFPLSLPAVE